MTNDRDHMRAHLERELRTEADAYRFLEKLRWPGQPTCPHCDSPQVYFLAPANGASRKTRTGSSSERRVWKCGSCRRQFSVLTGTIFHGTKVPVRTLVLIVLDACWLKRGVSIHDLESPPYSLATKTARFTLKRMREASTRQPLASLLDKAA